MPHEQLISNLKAALARALRISDEEVDLTCAMHAAGYTFTIYPHGMPTHAVGDDTVMLFEGGDGNALEHMISRPPPLSSPHLPPLDIIAFHQCRLTRDNTVIYATCSLRTPDTAG